MEACMCTQKIDSIQIHVPLVVCLIAHSFALSRLVGGISIIWSLNLWLQKLSSLSSSVCIALELHSHDSLCALIILHYLVHVVASYWWHCQQRLGIRTRKLTWCFCIHAHVTRRLMPTFRIQLYKGQFHRDKRSYWWTINTKSTDTTFISALCSYRKRFICLCACLSWGKITKHFFSFWILFETPEISQHHKLLPDLTNTIPIKHSDR